MRIKGIIMSNWKSNRNQALKELDALAEWSRANWWKTGEKTKREGVNASLHLGGKKSKKDEKDVDKSRNL
jgi:hypothetical protein